MNETYSISELAEAFDTTQRTVRYYEEKGLLSPARDSAGKRVYTRSDRIRLQLSLRGRRLGWSLNDICQIIQMYNSDSEGKAVQLHAAINRMHQTRATLLEQRVDIDVALVELEELEANCQRQLDELGETR